MLNTILMMHRSSIPSIRCFCTISYSISCSTLFISSCRKSNWPAWHCHAGRLVGKHQMGHVAICGTNIYCYCCASRRVRFCKASHLLSMPSKWASPTTPTIRPSNCCRHFTMYCTNPTLIHHFFCIMRSLEKWSEASALEEWSQGQTCLEEFHIDNQARHNQAADWNPTDLSESS